MRAAWRHLAFLVLATTVAACGEPTIPEATELQAAYMAKTLCSGTFVGGQGTSREAATRMVAPAHFQTTDLESLAQAAGIDVSVDLERQTVTAIAAGRVERVAVFHAGHGCTILPRGASNVLFEPVPVRSALPVASLQAWPMGDRVADEAPSPDVDWAALDTAVDLAFSEPGPGQALGTRALVAVYRGRVVAERYAPGFDQDSVMISWSMGKSLTAALVGLLVEDGHFDLDDPAPIISWQEPGDPRQAITIRTLLQMSSGLSFSRLPADDDRFFTHHNEHHYVYFEGIDVFNHATRPALEHAPGTVGRYRNSDPLTLGKIIRNTVTARGEDYFTFPQRALFDRIGMRDMVLERDPYGNMILTGYDHGTARDWARFGLLHLWDGVWLGERILPEGWVDFVSSPAPAWPDHNYGGLFWLNRGRQLADVPADAYWAAGAGGQRTVIIPSHDLVVVRMGYSLDNAALGANLNRVLSGIVAAVGGPPSARPPTD